ncbi:MAG: hypothetical protein Q7U31_09025, partial [Anaerolineaceae bacterium]|nr:hypothetical protein [Anaerolineaceae bacterium]
MVNDKIICIMKYEPVIGLEVHAELASATKMFCGCPVVDTTLAEPNTTVCPVCSGMPGTLPVLNQKAVEFGIRAALALECEVQRVSVFARKNYFYPDIPKGYQISQYELPLATNGRLVVDTTLAEPNTTVCPVCAGMPGTLPVLNQKAVEYGIRAALALECEVQRVSVFARKNYFYPDIPKGYQISQYELPLATNGRLVVDTPQGESVIRVRRAHLEEDTGKLSHIHEGSEDYSLVDLNRAGVPLLEIVSEPDMHSIEEVRGYATSLRAILKEIGVNSGDMEKGVIRFEANVSIRPVGSTELGTRTEIKNLNSFRAMERGILYELERQAKLLDSGQ